ncbi:MAG TPA: hypothetical protein VN989_14680 [Casimicrobiaceae bacterium]|nr:hypothetical protein [Casimicrobiaceae bacterium]
MPRAFDPDTLQANRHRHITAAIIEQLRLFGNADQMAGQRLRLKPAVLVELAKMRDRLLNDTTTNTHAAHQTPIAMNLPGLAQRRVAQIHTPNHT